MRRLTGFEQVRVASTMADDVLGKLSDFLTECLKCRGTQVVMQSVFRLLSAGWRGGRRRPGLGRYVAVQAGRVDSVAGLASVFCLKASVLSHPLTRC